MKKETQISLRLEAELVERFDRLVAKLAGASTRAALVRAAMLAGLPQLEARYEDVTDEPLAVKRKRSPKRG